MQLIQRLAKPKCVLVALAAVVFMAVGVMNPCAAKLEKLSGQPIKILDLQFGFSPNKAKTILSAYSPAARLEAARFLIWADTLYPIAYGIFLALLMAFLHRKGIWQFGMFLPICAVLIDYVENYLLYKILIGFPAENDDWIYLASACNQMKWSLIGLTGIAVIAGLLRRLIP